MYGAHAGMVSGQGRFVKPAMMLAAPSFGSIHRPTDTRSLRFSSHLVGRPDGDRLGGVVEEEEGHDHEDAVRPHLRLAALLSHDHT